MNRRHFWCAHTKYVMYFTVLTNIDATCVSLAVTYVCTCSEVLRVVSLALDIWGAQPPSPTLDWKWWCSSFLCSLSLTCSKSCCGCHLLASESLQEKCSFSVLLYKKHKQIFYKTLCNKVEWCRGNRAKNHRNYKCRNGSTLARQVIQRLHN